MKKIKIESRLVIDDNKVEELKEELKDLLDKYSCLEKDTRCSSIDILVDSSVEVNGFKAGKIFKVNDRYLLILEVDKKDDIVKCIFMESDDISYYLHPYFNFPIFGAIAYLRIKDDNLAYFSPYPSIMTMYSHICTPPTDLNPIFVREISKEDLAILITKIPEEPLKNINIDNFNLF